MMKNQHGRIDEVDIFRAIGIILMIMGHIKFGNHFDKWIHAFHMPMFFFVSGWFFRRKDNYLKQIQDKAKKLLIPYIVFESIQWILLLLFVPEYRKLQTVICVFFMNTSKIPIESGTFGISPIPGAMWFLTAIFFAESIYIVLERFISTRWMLHTAVGILVIIGMLAPQYLSVRLPWALDVAFVGIGLFHAARLIRHSKARFLFNLSFRWSIVISVVFSITIMISPKVNMRNGNYGLFFPFWINAFGAIVAGWNISRYIEKILAHVNPLKYCSKYLHDIGKNSIIYLSFNQIVILFVMILFPCQEANSYIYKAFVLLLTMIILFGFEKLICKTKLKAILHKKSLSK